MFRRISSLFKKKTDNNDQLLQFTNDTDFFTLNGLEVEAKVVDIYDGDTVKIVFKCAELNKKYYKWNCRINNVDTPEIRTKNEKEKEYAIQIRDKLRELMLNKIVTVTCGKFDKYGRLLVDIFIKDENDEVINVSNWLIENNYAKEYHGGTKEKWIF